MSRKSKYSVEQKLNILKEVVHSSVSAVAKKYRLNRKTIRPGIVYINIKELTAYALCTITIVIQRNSKYLWLSSTKIQTILLNYSQLNMD